MMIDLYPVSYALVVLYAAYMVQLCFRQPSTKVVSKSSESIVGWLIASPHLLVLVRAMTVSTCVYHALLALFISEDKPSDLKQICPVPAYLDYERFIWSRKTLAPWALLFTGCFIRFQAYAQLGTNFTYRIAKPDRLVTDGLYAYVRHPSYTGLLAVMVAYYPLFLHPRGVVSCWLPVIHPQIGHEAALHATWGFWVPMVGATTFSWIFMYRRVQDEEKMMQKEFGQTWRDYCSRTKQFIPFIV
jgi:protein-S-isoprenylcysteine O-methyltransferase Ste14